MIKRGNKKAYEFSFAWVFTVFIGAAVLFFAIYAATQLVDTKRAEEEAKTGKTIGILLTPVETNLEEGRSSTIQVKEETRIFNDCAPYLSGSNNYFGSQRISASVRSRIAEEWNPLPGVENAFHNKYLFSDGKLAENSLGDNVRYIQGEDEFYLFTKPLNLPFKIADLIMIWSDQQHYCFVMDDGENGPIIEEVEDLNLEDKNIELIKTGSPEDCKTFADDELIIVCFDTAEDAICDIKVSTADGSGTVKHKSHPDTLNYVESSDEFDPFPLLYAAIFSDPEIYKCQIERLGHRASALAKLHDEKLLSLNIVALCLEGINPHSGYINYIPIAEDLDNTNLINFKDNYVDIVYEENEGLTCKIF
jgi:hypothetical protein